MSQSAETQHPAANLASLFASFLGISLVGFGGVMPWARWMVVEKRRWLSPAEFNEAMALCQLLPGGNIINFAVIVGNRFCGAAGAFVAVAGLMIGPFALVILLATINARFSDVPALQGLLAGVSAAGAGLVASLAWKMGVSIRREGVAVLIAGAAFLAVGVFRVSLVATILVLGAVGVAYAWRRLA